MSRCLQPLPTTLARSWRPRRVLTPLRERATRAVRHARETRALRSPIARKLLGADHPLYVQPAVEERAAARLCCLLMAPPLAEAVEARGGVIYSAPPVMARPLPGQHSLSTH